MHPGHVCTTISGHVIHRVYVSTVAACPVQAFSQPHPETRSRSAGAPPIVFLRCTDTSITCICVYWYSVYFIYIYRSALRTLSSVLTLIEYGKQCCVVPHTLLTCHLNRIRKIPTLRWGGSRGFRPTRLVTWVTAYGGYVLCNNQIHRQCR